MLSFSLQHGCLPENFHIFINLIKKILVKSKFLFFFSRKHSYERAIPIKSSSLKFKLFPWYKQFKCHMHTHTQKHFFFYTMMWESRTSEWKVLRNKSPIKFKLRQQSASASSITAKSGNILLDWEEERKRKKFFHKKSWQRVSACWKSKIFKIIAPKTVCFIHEL